MGGGRDTVIWGWDLDFFIVFVSNMLLLTILYPHRYGNQPTPLPSLLLARSSEEKRLSKKKKKEKRRRRDDVIDH